MGVREPVGVRNPAEIEKSGKNQVKRTGVCIEW